MSAPVLVSIAAKDRTLIYTYDQLLDDSVDGDAADFAITSNGSPASFTEVSLVTFGTKAYLGVAELMPGVLITTNFTGGNSITNLAGEVAPAIINQNAAPNTSTGADTTAPTPIGGTIDGTLARIYFSEVLDAASIPAAAQFSFVTDDGTTIAGTGVVLVYGNRATVTLASAVDAGDVVAVNYTQPGANPLRDPALNKVASIYSLLLTNRTTDQAGYWTTRSAVENRYGEENTRIWSNKSDTETTAADPVAWAAALEDTDSKFNADFLAAGYDVPPYTAPLLLTSPYAARFKVLAAIWAGTELYFARGMADFSGGNDQQMRDKMQGWRDYVDAEMRKLFDAGLDIAVDVDSPADADGFQSVDIVRDSDVVIEDENSNGW